VRLVVSTGAKRDVEIEWVHLAEMSGRLEVANRFREALERAFLSLQHTPFLGRSRSEDLKHGLRSLAVKKYLVLYLVNGETVNIIRVLHGSRDIRDIFAED
jgi:toxin ParE1/3/4